MTAEVPLGEILKIDRDEVVIDPSYTYRTAGIYSFGRGVFERATIRGPDTSYRSLFRLHEGQVILSRLNGWEGAVDVVTAEIAGCHVSNEYPTFSLDEERADPGFLRWIMRWPALWDRLVPRGSMVRRKRVQPDQFLKISIPLPPIEEQRRVANLLGCVADRSAEIQTRCDRARDLSTALAVSSVARPDLTVEEKATSGWRTTLLADVIEPTYDVTPVDSTARYDVAGVYSFGRGMFERASLQGSQTSYKVLHRLHAGQLVMSRLKAWEGALAVVPPELDGWFVSPEFPTFDIDIAKVERDYLGALVTSEPFWTQLKQASQGIGARRERVHAALLLEHVIALPPLSMQQEIARGLRSIATASVLREDVLVRIQALVPAAINRTFAEFS